MERIYHETQVSSMCGVHCLNTLLQCNAFNEVDLATIGHELDAREREVMAEGGIESEEYLKFVAGSSNNVDESGNFSVSVLREALKVYNLSMTRWRSGKSEPHTECAFICNLREHWLTVRRLGSEWYNLNSLSSSPERISAFYLSAFLGQLSTEQYTIFSIEGQLPLGDESSGMAPSGKWWTQEEMDRAKAKRESGGGGGAAGPTDFGEALKNTLKTMQGGLATATSQVGEALGIGARRQSAAADEDEDLQAAIRASLGESEGPREGEGAGVTANPAYGGSPGDGGGDGGAQNDLEKALALSLEEFNQNKGGGGGE